MAQITWKNVDDLSKSAAPAYADFAKLLQQSLSGLGEGIKAFQDNRKANVTNYVQETLNKVTDKKDFESLIKSGELTKGIDPNLISAEVSAAIEAKRKGLENSELIQSNLLTEQTNRDLNKQGIVESNDRIATNALNREGIKLDNQSKQDKLDLAPYDKEKLLADIENARADARNTNSTAEYRAKAFDLTMQQHTNALEELQLTRKDQNALADFGSWLPTAHTMKEAEAKANSINASPVVKAQALAAARAKFPETAGSVYATAEDLNKFSTTPTGDSPFSNIGDIPVKSSSGKTNLLKDLGVEDSVSLKAKGGIHFGAGDTHPGTLALAQLMHKGLADVFDRVSGTNDDFHLKNSPNSTHTKGKGLDIVLKNTADYASETNKAIALLEQQGLVKGRDYEIQDEKNNPSTKATAPHIHFELKDSGAEKLKALSKQYTDREANRLKEDVVKEISSINTNAPLITNLGTSALEGQKAQNSLPQLRLPEGKSKDSNGDLSEAIVDNLRIPKENIPVIANIIDENYKSMAAKGKGISKEQVAQAVLASIEPQGAIEGFLKGGGLSPLSYAGLNQETLDRSLKELGSMRYTANQNFIKEQETALSKYQEATATLNNLLVAKASADKIAGLGENNSKTVTQLNKSIETQVADIKRLENSIKNMIDAADKKNKSSFDPEVAQDYPDDANILISP